MRFDSAKYWEDRYSKGGNSGRGSYGELAVFKASFLNDFVRQQDVKSVIEFGCGDGNQLKLAQYPSYTGFDVSEKAVALCRETFKGDETKQFLHLSQYKDAQADMSLSADVIFHLVEDEVFERHMQMLFGAATRFVVIYASNTDIQIPNSGVHFKQRMFSKWIEHNARGWRLRCHMQNEYPYRNEAEGSLSNFYVYERSII